MKRENEDYVEEASSKRPHAWKIEGVPPPHVISDQETYNKACQVVKCEHPTCNANMVEAKKHFSFATQVIENPKFMDEKGEFVHDPNLILLLLHVKPKDAPKDKYKLLHYSIYYKNPSEITGWEDPDQNEFFRTPILKPIKESDRVDAYKSFTEEWVRQLVTEQYCFVEETVVHPVTGLYDDKFNVVRSVFAPKNVCR